MYKFNILIIIILHVFADISFSETLSPQTACNPKSVISLQLLSLQNNNTPYIDAGIETVWNYAHPDNKENTGPFSRFKSMIYNKAYKPLINHNAHKITLKNKSEYEYIYDVEIITEKRIYIYQWKLRKLSKGHNKGCWLTVAVIGPIDLGDYI
tara:strand:+ start:138 stop:596 length:459 start_codon:yes stop_codon:yes gene_type:complete